MKNNKRYYETVDLLVKAYLRGELLYGNECQCVIGNMLQDKGIDKDIRTYWNDWLCDFTAFSSYEKKQLGKAHLKLLPYSINQIRKIESSFELCNNSKADVLDGLQAVEQTIYDMEDWSDEDLSVHEASERINKGTYELVLN